jgi:hypothetical protein
VQECASSCAGYLHGPEFHKCLVDCYGKEVLNAVPVSFYLSSHQRDGTMCSGDVTKYAFVRLDEA